VTDPIHSMMMSPVDSRRQDSRKAAGESEIRPADGAGQWAPAHWRESRGAAGGASQKGPAIGDGCQSREVTLRNVNRFAGALRVAIHTRTGKLFETP
jgi:hypothetical protein